MRVSTVAAIVSFALGCGRLHFDPIDGTTRDVNTEIDIGCADGEREGYSDVTGFPTIAACGATWTGALDMRTATSGSGCGDDLGPCAAPGDACAVGWHLCGSSGDVTELLVIDGATCRSIPGRYAAAVSECLTFTGPCTYPATGAWGCTTAGICGQPVCCGAGCHQSACADGIWPGNTFEPVNLGTTCGALSAADVDGVLCCKG